LGLALAQRAIGLHQGTMLAENSTPGPLSESSCPPSCFHRGRRIATVRKPI
jgi:hypothetical protein